MSGSDVGRAINDAAANCASHMRTPSEAHVGTEAHRALMEYVEDRVAPDMHEVCGDYDRPESPWYGSRPTSTPSLTWNTDGGPVAVLKRPEMRTAVIVMDTDGQPWIGEAP